MFKLLEFLKKRPSDTTIRSIRVLLSMMMVALLIYTNGSFILPWQSFYAVYATWIVYTLAALFIIHAIVFGILGLCVYKRSVMKKIQMLAGLACIVIGSGISYELPVSIPSNENAVSTVALSDIAKPISTPIHVGGWLIFYGILTLIVGISGKMITEKCAKHKEIITKIRI